jgi:hypothetical protein
MFSFIMSFRKRMLPINHLTYKIHLKIFPKNNSHNKARVTTTKHKLFACHTMIKKTLTSRSDRRGIA